MVVDLKYASQTALTKLSKLLITATGVIGQTSQDTSVIDHGKSTTMTEMEGIITISALKFFTLSMHMSKS